MPENTSSTPPETIHPQLESIRRQPYLTDAGSEQLTPEQAVESLKASELSDAYLKAARQTASQIEDDDSRSQVQLAIAQALVESGQIDEASQTASQIERDHNHSGGQLVIAQALAKSGQFDQARQTVSQIKDRYYRSQAQLEITQALTKSGQFDQARQTASQIEDDDSRSEAQLAIAQATGDVADFDQVRQTASQLEDTYYRSEAQLAIAQALIQKATDLRQNWETMSEADKQAVSRQAEQLTGTLDFPGRLESEQAALSEHRQSAIRQGLNPELISLTELELTEHDRELYLDNFLPLMSKLENAIVLVQHIDSIEQLASLLSTLDHESLPELMGIGKRDHDKLNKLTSTKAIICQNLISSLKLTDHDARLKDRSYLRHDSDEESANMLKKRQAAIRQLERLIANDTDVDLLTTLFDKGYGINDLFTHPWLATREVADFDGEPFPVGGNRQHQARWLAQHCFSSLPGFNKTSIGQIILTRLNTGLESSVHDASQWLASFSVPEEAFSIAEARQQALEHPDSLEEPNLEKHRLYSTETELHLLLSVWRADDLRGQDLPGLTKPGQINRYSGYFSDQINTLVYQALISSPSGSSQEDVKRTIAELSDRYLKVLLDPQTKEMTTHIKNLDDLKAKAISRFDEIIAASSQYTEPVKITTLLGQLKRMSEARQAYINDATKWLSGNSDTPHQKLTKAWGDRPLAIAEGAKDSPTDILRWANNNALIIVARQMADDDGIIRQTTKKGREREFDIRRLRSDYGDLTRELTRCYSAEKSIRAVMKYDRLHNLEADFPAAVIELASGHRFEILSKDDPRGFTIGSDTGCCMTVDGISSDCIWAGYRDRRYGFAALYDPTGKLTAQSLIYHDPEQDKTVMVLDNIEFNAGRDVHKIYEVYETALTAYLEQQRVANPDFTISQVNVGLGFLTVSVGDLEKAESIIESPDCNYSDAAKQRIVLKLPAAE